MHRLQFLGQEFVSLGRFADSRARRQDHITCQADVGNKRRGCAWFPPSPARCARQRTCHLGPD